MDATLACAVHGGAIAKQVILPGALTCTPTARPACAQTVAEQLIPQPPKLPAAIWLNPSLPEPVIRKNPDDSKLN